MATTAAPVAHEVKGLPALLDTTPARARIEPFLPKGVSYERVVAAALLAARKDPNILRCSPESIVMAVAKIVQWGLEIGETAHLVPFGGVLTPIADYKGLAQLLYASKAIRSISAECVYEKELENDGFIYEKGTQPKIYHRPILRGDRGAMIGAYVYIDLPFQRWIALFMRLDEIDEIRKKCSKQWKTGDCPAWYAKKTVIRQAAKLLPKDPRMAEAMSVMQDEADGETLGEEVPAPVVPPPLVGGPAKAPKEPSEFADFQDDRDLMDDGAPL
jgi:recombination protein RecT